MLFAISSLGGAAADAPVIARWDASRRVKATIREAVARQNRTIELSVTLVIARRGGTISRITEIQELVDNNGQTNGQKIERSYAESKLRKERSSGEGERLILVHPHLLISAPAHDVKLYRQLLPTPL